VDDGGMNKNSRWILAVGALLLIGMYFLPLWSITVEAPQYPEGLGIYIRINTVDGHARNDLKNLNIVNHYIGMQEIVPESIPELKYMPGIVGFMLVSGLIVAWKGGRKLLYVWLALFLILALVGLIDFYLWNYDFGHNLDTEHAAIQIEGMTYQPPLFGTKTMLNFVTTSLPAGGGILAFISIFMGFLAAILSWRDPQAK
jgi:copper chaperone NosL